MSGLHVFIFEDEGELRARWAESDGIGKSRRRGEDWSRAGGARYGGGQTYGLWWKKHTFPIVLEKGRESCLMVGS